MAARAGVSASFMRYPDDDVTIIVLSNYSDGAIEPARTLEAIMFGQPYEMPARPLGEVLYREIADGGIDSAAGVEAVIEREGAPSRSSIPLNQLGYELLAEDPSTGRSRSSRSTRRAFPTTRTASTASPRRIWPMANGTGYRDLPQGPRGRPDFASSRRMLEQLTAGR